MQRMLITITVIALVVVALLAGTLAANWPFWQRAWAWQTAIDGWPTDLPGPQILLQPAQNPLPLHVQKDQRLADVISGSDTEMLLLGDTGGRVAAWFGAGHDEHLRIDGHGLIGGMLAPLWESLPGATALLDQPLRNWLVPWRKDARGSITPRQLLWQLSGLEAAPFVPLNPFSHRAQLASGPNFDRAARHTQLVYPPGSHFEPTPANAQLLADVIGRQEHSSFAALLERQLWSQFAADTARGTLDHPRGAMAAHCCFEATAADWLRWGVLLAADGRVGSRQVLPAGMAASLTAASPVHEGYGLGYAVRHSPEMGTVLILDTPGRQLAIAQASGRALLWVGRGTAPAAALTLLSLHGFPMQ